MKRLLSEVPSIISNTTRHNVAFARAISSEAVEFLNTVLITSKIGLQAMKSNPLSVQETTDVTIHSLELASKALNASAEKTSEYIWDQANAATTSFFNTLLNREGQSLSDFISREADVMEAVADFHEEIENVKDEFGFHLETTGYKLVGETDAFEMYQVLPTKNVSINNDLKPMLLVSPYMLGAHILSFLPHEDKSYAHAFANAGIPTYIRIVKDIMKNESVQLMTPEDDCLQTKELCEILVRKHINKVALNGTCQGGYICLINVLSGELQELCDVLITNVTPIDGTYSSAISGMPTLHHDFITTTLPNGNRVANGYLLSLGMKFVAIDRETPLVRVLDQAALHRKTNLQPGKTVAALFNWLTNERTHLPMAIANMSSITFRASVKEDGKLPVKLFNSELNIKDLAKYNVYWYQNYAVKDDLVTPECATAANKHLNGLELLETVPFPGGHVSILTSPFNKKAPVDNMFTGVDGKQYRGPVKFMLDIS